MTRLMHDSVNAAAIPADAEMVMLYTDGLRAAGETGIGRGNIAQAGRFTRATIVRCCAVQWKPGDQVIDCERFDFNPAQAAAAALEAAQHGQAVLTYFSVSRFAEVFAAFKAAGAAQLLEVFAADWTGQAHIVKGTYATQYDHPPHSGGDYDLSLMADHIPGIDPPQPAPAPPAPAPTPPPPQPIEPPPVPEPAPVAEAGVSTSEWRLAIAYVAQLAAGGTAALVNAISQSVWHVSVTIPPDVLQVVVDLEFAGAIVGGGYILSRGIRKLGSS